MLPPNIAHLAARAKAADSLGLRYTDVTVTHLEGAVTEATMLVDEVDAANSSSDRAATDTHELRRELLEARELARELLGAGQELAEDRTFLAEFSPSLEWELLPGWLTHEAGSPETWERGQ